jgi:hypothetical protein
MTPPRSRRRWLWLLVFLPALIATTVFVVRNQRAIGDYLHNQMVLDDLQGSSDPIARALARREFRAGSAVDDVIARFPPPANDQHGPYTTLRYGTPQLVTYVIAKNGKLICAYTVDHGRWCDYFGRETMDVEIGQYVATRKAMAADRRVALLAIAGSAATAHPKFEQ